MKKKVPQLSYLWWMPNSVSKAFSPALTMDISTIPQFSTTICEFQDDFPLLSIGINFDKRCATVKGSQLGTQVRDVCYGMELSWRVRSHDRARTFADWVGNSRWIEELCIVQPLSMSLEQRSLWSIASKKKKKKAVICLVWVAATQAASEALKNGLFICSYTTILEETNGIFPTPFAYRHGKTGHVERPNRQY